MSHLNLKVFKMESNLCTNHHSAKPNQIIIFLWQCYTLQKLIIYCIVSHWISWFILIWRMGGDNFKQLFGHIQKTIPSMYYPWTFSSAWFQRMFLQLHKYDVSIVYIKHKDMFIVVWHDFQDCSEQLTKWHENSSERENNL